jgi:prophage endopeptidase
MTRAALIFIAHVATFAVGYTVADWRLTGQHTAEKLEAARGAAKALADMTAARDQLSAALTAANDLHTSELRKAQNETNSLRDRLRAGNLRLRVAAVCPDSTAQTAGGTRVDSGTGAELDEPARRAYFALRDGIDRATAQLAACQDELKLRVGAH